eukprot:gene5628-1885_t
MAGERSDPLWTQVHANTDVYPEPVPRPLTDHLAAAPLGAHPRTRHALCLGAMCLPPRPLGVPQRGAVQGLALLTPLPVRPLRPVQLHLRDGGVLEGGRVMPVTDSTGRPLVVELTAARIDELAYFHSYLFFALHQNGYVLGPAAAPRRFDESAVESLEPDERERAEDAAAEEWKDAYGGKAFFLIPLSVPATDILSAAAGRDDLPRYVGRELEKDEDGDGDDPYLATLAAGSADGTEFLQKYTAPGVTDVAAAEGRLLSDGVDGKQARFAKDLRPDPTELRN